VHLRPSNLGGVEATRCTDTVQRQLPVTKLFCKLGVNETHCERKHENPGPEPHTTCQLQIVEHHFDRWHFASLRMSASSRRRCCVCLFSTLQLLLLLPSTAPFVLPLSSTNSLSSIRCGAASEGSYDRLQAWYIHTKHQLATARISSRSAHYDFYII
jgi:hypothetical protein